MFHADTEGLKFRKAFTDAGFQSGGRVYLGEELPGCWDARTISGSTSQCCMDFSKNGKHPWYSDRKQTTIWNYDKPKRNANHPTSKPLDLLGYPIGNSPRERRGDRHLWRQRFYHDGL